MSFRGDPKGRTRNLEIVIARFRGRVFDDYWIMVLGHGILPG